MSTTPDIKQRLEYLRGELRAERISYEELHELQSLASHIPAGDVELLEAAGVPEQPQQRERWRAYHNPITKTSVVAFEADGPPMTKPISPERANLIAAAPKLLAALRAVLDSEDTTLGDGGSILGDDLRRLAQDAISAATEVVR